MTIYDKIHEYITAPSYSPATVMEFYDIFSSDANANEITDAIGKLIDEGLATYGKGGKLVSFEKAGYLKGTFRSNAKGFGFFTPDVEFTKRTGGDLFIPVDKTENAVDGDVVLCLMTSQPSGDKNGEGRIVKIIEHTLKTVVGVLCTVKTARKNEKLSYFVDPDDKHLPFDVDVSDIANARVDDKVEVAIDTYPVSGNPAKGHIIAVFGEAESTHANFLSVVHQCGIKTEFDGETLAEAEKVSSIPVSAEGRTDMRDKIIMTIDSAEAKDLDDAISIEKSGNGGFILGVHIADVSNYVRENTALDGEAFERGTSVYFADKVIPMLPECISNGCCSLNSGTDKYTLSAMVEIDENGEILGCTPVEGIINTTVRGVYSEVNDILAKGTDSEFYQKYEKAYPMFPLMSELYTLLEAKGKRRGALELENVDAKIVMEDGEPVDIVKVERGISERMIEQFMLAANEAVATWLFWQDMPCVYRIHEEPDEEKIKSFKLFAYNCGLDITGLNSKKIHSSALGAILEQAKQKDNCSNINYMLLRSLMKAKYSSTCIPHFGLAIEKYCHFTSPIRRYPDLSVHRIVKAVLHGEMDDERVKQLTAFAERSAEHSSLAENKAVTCERAMDDLYKTILMSYEIDKIFEGTISSVTSFGLFVELDNTCEGLIPIKTLNGYFEYNEKALTLSCGYTTYSLGQKVKVRIEDCDIIARRVEMSLVPDREYA